jgi:hypothetical protein
MKKHPVDAKKAAANDKEKREREEGLEADETDSRGEIHHWLN